MVSSLKTHRSTSSGTVRREDDAFAADESGVRWDLVTRVREALEDGSYNEDARIDALLDRLVTDLEF